MNQEPVADRRSRRFWWALAAAGGIAVSLGGTLRVLLARPLAVEATGVRLEVCGRVRTGHQRAERLVFLDGGRRLAVACPRYNRVVIYRVGEQGHLDLDRDVPLDGRPVALAAAGSDLIVLQRPAGDARHVEEAWWDVLGADDRPIGSRFRVGFDPDDLALSADGRTALVLRSGRAEGETNRPAPSLLVVDRTTEPPRPLGQVEFAEPGDDPERLAWDAETGRAAVSMRGSRAVVALDLSDPARPRLTRRWSLPKAVTVPGPIGLDGAGRVRLADAGGSGLWRIDSEGGALRLAPGIEDFTRIPSADILGLNAVEGTIEIRDEGGRRLRLRLSRLGDFRPVALAAAEQTWGHWIAVSDRSGGVELVRMRATAP